MVRQGVLSRLQGEEASTANRKAEAELHFAQAREWFTQAIDVDDSEPHARFQLAALAARHHPSRSGL
jgi:hypothetical protein